MRPEETVDELDINALQAQAIHQVSSNKSEEIERISGNFKKNASIVPLQRCTEDGIAEFITKEASSYTCDYIGTIHDSVAKKAVDDYLQSERKDMDSEISYKDTSESNSAFEQYPSHVSLDKIKELLTTFVNQWVFQTSNDHRLISFYAKAPNSKTGVFVNFKEEGESSYICLGINFGYINSEVLEILKEKLSKVYHTVSKEADERELVWERTNSNNTVTKFEKINLKDPDYWNLIKESALHEFLFDRRESLLEKLFRFLDDKDRDNIEIHHLLKEEILNDNTVVNFLLENIKIDIRQIYA